MTATPSNQAEVAGATAPPASVSAPEDGPWFTVKRSGKKPLRFRGVQLAEATSWRLGSPLWHEIALYRRTRGDVVAAVTVFKKAAQERDVFRAESFGSLEEAALFLEGYDPTGDLTPGFDPDDPSLGAAQLALCAAGLRQRAEQTQRDYQALLGDLLYQLDLTE